MLQFFQKNKKNTCRYHYQNLDVVIYCSWYIEENILKLVILGHFLPLYSLKTKKIKILKHEKIYWIYYHFTHVYQKSQSHDVQFLRYRVRQTEFFVTLGHSLPFYHLPIMILKIKILKKNEKNAWRYYPLIHTCVP